MTKKNYVRAVFATIVLGHLGGAAIGVAIFQPFRPTQHQIQMRQFVADQKEVLTERARTQKIWLDAANAYLSNQS